MWADYSRFQAYAQISAIKGRQRREEHDMREAKRVMRTLLGLLRVGAGRRGARVLVMEQDGRVREGHAPSMS
jgi:hypothetical protein